MGIQPPDLRLAALSLGCGLYALASKPKTRLIADYLGKNPEPLLEKLRVMDYVNEKVPPAFVFTFGGDFLRQDSETFAEE